MDRISSSPSALPDVSTEPAESLRPEPGGPPTDLPPSLPPGLGAPRANLQPTSAHRRAGETTTGRVAQRTGQAKPIESGFSALWRGAVKLATKIPWLNTTSAVLSAAQNIRRADAASNRGIAVRADLFNAFVEGLQSTYGEAATDAAIRLTRLSPTDFLSASIRSQAQTAAEVSLALQGSRETPK